VQAWKLEEIEGAWVPARHVQQAQKCATCRVVIPKGAPGTSTGSRGTKAWYNRLSREWECIACRSEGMRADDARQAMRRSAEAAKGNGPWDAAVLFDLTGRLVKGHVEWAEAYRANTLATLKTRKVQWLEVREIRVRSEERMKARGGTI
jgi:hypothetical protein